MILTKNQAHTLMLIWTETLPLFLDGHTKSERSSEPVQVPLRTDWAKATDPPSEMRQLSIHTKCSEHQIRVRGFEKPATRTEKHSNQPKSPPGEAAHPLSGKHFNEAGLTGEPAPFKSPTATLISAANKSNGEKTMLVMRNKKAESK